MGWKTKLEPQLKKVLEVQVAETLRYKGAYERAPSPSTAQLWVALAQAVQKIEHLEARLAAKETTAGLKKKKVSAKKQTKAKKQLLDSLENL